MGILSPATSYDAAVITHNNGTSYEERLFILEVGIASGVCSQEKGFQSARSIHHTPGTRASKDRANKTQTEDRHEPDIPISEITSCDDS